MSKLTTYGFRRYTICTDIGFAQYENKTKCLTCHYDVIIEGYVPYCTTRKHRRGCVLEARFEPLIKALREARP